MKPAAVQPPKGRITDLSVGRWVVWALLVTVAGPGRALEWLHALPLENGACIVASPATGPISFLRFGDHAFAPVRVADANGRAIRALRGEPILVAPFQQLWIELWMLPPGVSEVRLEKPMVRDAFWDQVIAADPSVLGPLPRYPLLETGTFGAVLPAAVRQIDHRPEEIRRQQASLIDPIIPPVVEREIPWAELEAQAYPLDFQKVLLASPNDSAPGFAYQNGQWFTTWPSRDLPAGNKEDHWFAPALLIGGRLVRPAPLSARTAFARTGDGVTVPLWTLEWGHAGITIRQQLFSQRPVGGTVPRIFVRFQLINAPAGTQLALGTGRRPNVHYWDDTARARTPIPFFSLAPRYVQSGHTVLDAWGNVVLASPQSFRLEPLGPLETLLVFEADAQGGIAVETPQAELPPAAVPATAEAWTAAEAEFLALWSARIEAGARVRLPAPEWMERIHIWRSQIEAITRVHYQGRERLSYGADFYQAYFGVEEAWPAVALALWGRTDEAQRQAAIMLEPENLSKTNVHHQSRNGIGPFAAATIARLTRDPVWLGHIAPVLRECARWTEDVRQQGAGSRPALTRGLLPPHIYGGDVRDPATSLYATAACWRGMQATAEAFRELGSPALATEGATLAAQAAALRQRLARAFSAVTDRTVAPPFVPFALALPSLGGRNEGPYDRLTATRYGNYWNLFAPSFLELDFKEPNETAQPNRSVFSYAEQHGGLWAGQPRFYDGLDAAYAIGYLGYLLDRAAGDGRYRPQALASLQAFMLHGSSRNGYTIPEVAGLFPERLQAAAYEQLVREAPWSFGMYDADRYLAGHIAFTEPLGAGAGAALTLVRRALLSEDRDDLGQPDGGLVLLPAVPADWLGEGREIVLEDMPTFYGRLSATIRSRVVSRKEIVMEYEFAPFASNDRMPLRFRLRCAPPGRTPQEISFVPLASGVVHVQF